MPRTRSGCSALEILEVGSQMDDCTGRTGCLDSDLGTILTVLVDGMVLRYSVVLLVRKLSMNRE